MVWQGYKKGNKRTIGWTQLLILFKSRETKLSPHVPTLLLSYWMPWFEKCHMGNAGLCMVIVLVLGKSCEAGRKSIFAHVRAHSPQMLHLPAFCQCLACLQCLFVLAVQSKQTLTYKGPDPFKAIKFSAGTKDWGLQFWCDRAEGPLISAKFGSCPFCLSLF